MPTKKQTESRELHHPQPALSDLGLYLRLLHQLLPDGFPERAKNSQVLSGVFVSLNQLGLLDVPGPELRAFVEGMNAALDYLRSNPDGCRTQRFPQLQPAPDWKN